MHAGCMRDSLVAALAEHGAVMQAAMHQALQTIVVPAPPLTLVRADPAPHPADAAPLTALQLNEQRQDSKQPEVQAPAEAGRCSDMPSQAAQQQIDTAQEQVDPSQQQYGGLCMQTAAVVVLPAPQSHPSMVSRVPETAPAQLPLPSAPDEVYESGASAAASGARKQPALLTYSRTAKRGSSSFAEAVHPEAASDRDSKRSRHGDTGANLSSPSLRKLQCAQDVHSCRFWLPCQYAALSALILTVALPP